MRSSRLDNIKAVLTLLVVYGHLLELNKDLLSNGIYLIIYSFHMPAFVFCSGLVAKYGPRKAAAGILYPYFVFQTLYVLIFRDKFTYLTPYWLMWYLPALFVWRMMLGLVNTKKRALAALGIGLALCIAAGFVKGIGYFLSLSRIICLYPFFIAGVLIGRYKMKGVLRFIRKHRRLLTIASAVSLALMLLLGAAGIIYEKNFYYTKPYRGTADFLFRVQLVITAFCIISVLLTSIKNKKYFFTGMGKRSLTVYLLHGFIVEGMRGRVLFHEPLLPLVSAFFITAVLSSETVYRLSAPLIRPLGRKK